MAGAFLLSIGRDRAARQDLPRVARLYEYTAPLEFEAPVLSSSKSAEQLTLVEAIDLIVYGANCDRCHETRRVDLAQLRDKLGPRFLVGDIRARLRCTKCGNRKVIVVTLWRSSTSTESMSAHWK